MALDPHGHVKLLPGTCCRTDLFVQGKMQNCKKMGLEGTSGGQLVQQPTGPYMF